MRAENEVMRATLTIDDDLYARAKALAQARSMTIDQMISELARKGLDRVPIVRDQGQLPTFTVPADAKTFTTEDVRRGEDEP